MIRPLSWFWPPLAVMPSLRSAPGTLPPSIDSGSSTAVTTVLRSSASPKISSPIACGAGAGGAGEQVVAGEDVLQALLEDHVERDVEAEEQRHGGREGRVALALGLEVLAPVEVVAAAGLLRGVVERRAARRTRSRGRAGTSAPSASRRRRRRSPTRPGAARRRRGRRRRRRRGSRRGACTTSAIAWTSCTMPVEVSLSVAKATSMPSFSPSRRSNSAGSRRSPQPGS